MAERRLHQCQLHSSPSMIFLQLKKKKPFPLPHCYMARVCARENMEPYGRHRWAGHSSTKKIISRGKTFLSNRCIQWLKGCWNGRHNCSTALGSSPGQQDIWKTAFSLVWQREQLRLPWVLSRVAAWRDLSNWNIFKYMNVSIVWVFICVDSED